MRCKECEKQGLKSKVYPGTSWCTCLAWQPYYDEDGKYHNKNPNTTTTTYRCSNGHT